MKHRTEYELIQEAQMRAFFTSCGLSKSTSDAAMKVRRNEPVDRKRVPLRRNKPKAPPQAD